MVIVMLVVVVVVVVAVAVAVALALGVVVVVVVAGVVVGRRSSGVVVVVVVVVVVSTTAQLCPTSGTLFHVWLALCRCHGLQTPFRSLPESSASLVCTFGDLGNTKPWDHNKISPGA